MAVVQAQKKVFGAALDALDAPAGEAPREAALQGNAQIGAPRLGPYDARAENSRLETAAHGLHLGKFGHGRNLAPTGPVGYGRPAMPETENHGAADGKSEVDFGYRRVPAAEKDALVRGVFETVAHRYDAMNDLMSWGVHRLWKQALVDALAPRPGMRILDLAGGTGDVAMRIGGRVRGAGGVPDVVVCDLTPAMVEAGRDRAIDRGQLDGIAWLCGDAQALPLRDRSVDACTIAFGLRNVSLIDRALAEVRRVLRPGGRFLCLEFSRVVVPMLGPLYDRYSFSVLPALGRMVAGDGEAYRYLAESIRRFPDQETLACHMTEAGFARVTWRNLSGGIAALHSGWRI